jgi:hypothetical protein
MTLSPASLRSEDLSQCSYYESKKAEYPNELCTRVPVVAELSSRYLVALYYEDSTVLVQLSSSVPCSQARQG